MKPAWRLLVCDPRPGDWNMAVDDMLLEQAVEQSRPALRIYSWDQPTLSLGYFQSLEDIPPEHRTRRPVVRRTTGGGAILHDRELTYSLATPKALLDGAKLYALANQAILLAIRRLGAQAHVRGPLPGQRAQRGPFFCFARPGSTDIIARAGKLAGAAQRRTGGGILQQGSILLAGDQAGTIALNELAGRPVALDELAAELVLGFQELLNVRFEPSDLTAAEKERTEQIRLRRYGNSSWLSHGNRKVLK
ncbi:MAG: hypothetical protein GWP05_10865 [Anaerolineaceae bacterium]|nr:hypothetical protein [Anaerolineaceae bacterium]